MPTNESVEIFCCYAHEDRSYLLELKKQLAALLRLHLINNIWYDANISPGMDWEGEIKKHLHSAKVIILLVSPDFMDSDYCYGKEMVQAIERHERGEAQVIPIILRPVYYWNKAPFGKLQALPTDAQPVTIWQNRDEAFRDVAEGIHRAITVPVDLDQKQLSLSQSKKGYCSLVHKATGKCLDAYGHRVYLCAANGGRFQLWRAIGVSPNLLVLQHFQSGKVLDTTPEGSIHLSEYNNTPSQQWRLEDAGDGYNKLRQIATGEPPGMLLDGGANDDVYLHNENGGDFQLWRALTIQVTLLIEPNDFPT